MSDRRIPKRVQINGIWYDVKEGWAGKLELCEYMKAPQYIAEEPYAHVTNLFYVKDVNGNKVGEFNTNLMDWSGSVNSIEM